MTSQLRENWSPDPERVVVVAGRRAKDCAARFGVFWNHNQRSFRPSQWMAFYESGSIQLLAEIEGPPRHDVVIARESELEPLAAFLSKSGVNPANRLALVRLKNLEEIGPIQNDKVDKLGRATAWVQSLRYTTLSRIRAAKLTSEL